MKIHLPATVMLCLVVVFFTQDRLEPLRSSRLTRRSGQISACFTAAIAIPAFRNPISWIGLLAGGALAGFLAMGHGRGDIMVFLWEAFTVGLTAFFMGLGDRADGSSPVFRDVTSTIYRRLPRSGG